MKTVLLYYALILLLTNCQSKREFVFQPEFQTYFKEYNVSGSFLLYDFQQNKTIIYNEERCNQGFLPASTFKIVNTLIGLEIGIIEGEDFVIPWDSINRQIPVWNKNHNLTSAFKNYENHQLECKRNSCHREERFSRMA